VFKKPIVRNFLSALAVAVLGFVLLHVAFIVDALYQRLLDWCIQLFVHIDADSYIPWIPAVKHGSFLVLMALASWLVFRSRLGVLYKAAFLTVPYAAGMVTIGMALFAAPKVLWVTGPLLTVGLLYLLYRTRQPWLYYYAVALVGTALLIGALMGIDI
jgi:hypothetical protein